MGQVARCLTIAVLLAGISFALPVLAQETEAPADPLAEIQTTLASQKVMIDTVWVIVAGMMVFFMNTGFGMLESGFCRSKNAVNILSKNFVVFAIAVLAFWAVGFGFMFASGNDWIGTGGFLLAGEDNSPATGDTYAGIFGSLNWTGIPLYLKFFFQAVFAGTAATIVSGAVAERIKYQSFLVFSFFLVAVLYPITGHWIWGGGWLGVKGFHDFAGSTVVHSCGGWAALTGVIILGPRLGKYREDGTVHPILGHNMTSAFIGCMILWLGWYGFNPGSTMGADVDGISRVALTTTLSAAAGTLAGTLTIWLVVGKPDLGMAINGCLAGLVAITAPCYVVSPLSSVIIGTIGGILVVFAVIFFEKLKIDDPVGAISVHLVNGIWGTIAVGLFADEQYYTVKGLFTGGGVGQLITQLIGIAAVGVFTFVASMIIWIVIKLVMGLRVSVEEERLGLDITEMGMEAYPTEASMH